MPNETHGNLGGKEKNIYFTFWPLKYSPPKRINSSFSGWAESEAFNLQQIKAVGQHKTRPFDPNLRAIFPSIRLFYHLELAFSKLLWERRLGLRREAKASPLKAVWTLILVPRLPVPGGQDLGCSHSSRLKNHQAVTSLGAPTYLPNCPKLSYFKGLSSSITNKTALKSPVFKHFNRHPR